MIDVAINIKQLLILVDTPYCNWWIFFFFLVESSNPNGKIIISKAHESKCYFTLAFNLRVGLRRILQNWTLKGKAVTSKLVTSKCECVLRTRFELVGRRKKEDLWPRRDCPQVLVWEPCELECTILTTGQRMTQARQVEKFLMWPWLPNILTRVAE